MARLSLVKNVRIEEHSGLDSLESVQPLWEQRQTHPNADFDFFSTIVRGHDFPDSPADGVDLFPVTEYDDLHYLVSF